MDEKPRRRPRMTGWFDPGVMAQSAAMMFTANIFGRHSDTRLIEALGSQPQDLFDYSVHDGDFWIDYVADLGDGWNPTYAIAEALSREELQGTRSGKVLVFGGDRSIRIRTREAYAATPNSPIPRRSRPHAAPGHLFHSGNHDWSTAGGVLALVLSAGPRVRGCATRQTRSISRCICRGTGGSSVSTCSSERISTNRRALLPAHRRQMTARANVIL